MSRKRFSGAVPPVENNFLGSYSLGLTTGIIAAALSADSEIFQFRWAPDDTSKIAVVRKVLISAAVSTTYFAAGVPLEVALMRSSAWTAAGTGGTAIDPAALAKRRSTFDDSAINSGDIRIATTGALGAGTKTLETLAMGKLISGAPITTSLSGQIFPAGSALLDAYIDAGEWPITLADEQGLSITVPLVPGTGTWKACVNIVWDEYSEYPY